MTVTVPDFTTVVHVIWQVGGTTIITGLVGLLWKALQYFHVTLTAAQAAKTSQIIFDAIAYASEVSAASIKAGKPVPSQQKLSLAVGYVQRQASSLTPEQITDFIHAALPKTVEGATPAPGAVVVAAPRPSPIQMS